MNLSNISAFSPTDYPDFVTHKYYLEFLSKVSDKLELRYLKPLDRSTHLNKSKKIVSQRLTLIDLNFNNLAEECGVVMKNAEFARAAIPWIGVKAYYLVFYLTTLLMYVLTENELSFYAKHSNARKFLPLLIESNTVEASSMYFNGVFERKAVEKYRSPIHINLRTRVADDIRYRGLLKKIYEYGKEDYKIQNKLTRLAGHKKAKFNQQKISLFDFFYWYRIKSNYRDMDFMADYKIPTKQVEAFYNSYFLATFNVSTAIRELINDIYQARTSSKIF